jgi:hypothetical protein
MPILTGINPKAPLRRLIRNFQWVSLLLIAVHRRRLLDYNTITPTAMSRAVKARQTLAAATRTPVELTPLRKMIRLPVVDAMPHLTSGPAAIRLPLDVVSLEYRYHPKHTSIGSKWVRKWCEVDVLTSQAVHGPICPANSVQQPAHPVHVHAVRQGAGDQARLGGYRYAGAQGRDDRECGR